MYNKRILLLTITLIAASGWAYPTYPGTTGDTTAVSATIPAASSSPSIEDNFYNELFIAANIGSSNGVRLNPKAVSFVQDYMKENWDDLQNIRSWGRPYFNLIETILTEYDLPKELKYLAVIESNLKSTAVSRAGAKGPWQLMPQTARDLGLRVNRDIDERKSYTKSTRAVALYLRDLYNELGDWLLVIAAYNCGTANVNHAIHRSGSRNFWVLQNYLPLESRLHVKKFIATQYTFEGQGSVTTLTRAEATEQLSGSAMYIFHRNLTAAELDQSRTLNISGKYYSSAIAKYTLLDSSTFTRYNPDFDKIMASTNNSYDLKLPASKMDLFIANKYDILRESVDLLAQHAERPDNDTMEAGVAVK